MDASQRATFRVAHLTLSHTPFDVRVFEKECRTLADAGYDVHLAVPGAPSGGRHGSVTLHGIPIDGDGHPLARWRARLAAALAVAQRIDAQLYHLHDPELIPVGLKLARGGARIVYDAHEDAPLEAWSLNRGRPLHRLALPALWWTLLAQAKRRFDLFVAATPGIATRFPTPRTIEVRNYPRLEVFPRADTARTRQRAVIFAGLLNESRGALRMLDALEAMANKDVQLWLYGAFASDALRQRMEQHPAWTRVVHFGPRPWRDVIEAYGRASAGLMLYEGTPEQRQAIPVKLFELLLSGLPVVATDVAYWRRLIGIGKPAVRFADPDDASRVAAILDQWIEAPEQAAHLGAGGAFYARSRFDWKPEGERLVAAYDRLLG